ncbi:hypothetical protein C0Q70_11233 [Pomacea canaliculata]|uniref:Uncharacterized protein n=1 Tax=Pomacea canaliculata TaxID=400727 RepID=A0A2T7P5D9_POMCA|nr:rho-related GTP-binding protein RhoA-B-like isoform X2 [Pomacea canaliculata]PVD28639.1 hypothetical protein C0Q70_11233 [Pomacea canaliculata]
MASQRAANERRLLFLSPRTSYICCPGLAASRVQSTAVQGSVDTGGDSTQQTVMPFSCFGAGKWGGAVEEEATHRIQCKAVVVGDGECGKTCLLQRFCRDTYSSQGYLPTVFDTQVVDMVSGTTTIELTLMDTAGQEDYDRLRPFAYPDTDVVIICFSVDNPDSLENVLLTWVPEVRYFCGDTVSLVLVGNKKDVRLQNEVICPTVSDTHKAWSAISFIKQGPVKAARAMSVAADIGAAGYWETSALMDQGVDEVFQAVCKLALMRRVHKRGRRSTGGKNSLMARITGR